MMCSPEKLDQFGSMDFAAETEMQWSLSLVDHGETHRMGRGLDPFQNPPWRPVFPHPAPMQARINGLRVSRSQAGPSGLNTLLRPFPSNNFPFPFFFFLLLKEKWLLTLQWATD